MYKRQGRDGVEARAENLANSGAMLGGFRGGRRSERLLIPLAVSIDVYMFGMLLYELLAPPAAFWDYEFNDRQINDRQVIKKVLRGERPVLSGDALSPLLARCWRDANERPEVNQVLLEFGEAFCDTICEVRTRSEGGSGYLRAKPGDQILDLHVGCKRDEEGWVFGELRRSSVPVSGVKVQPENGHTIIFLECFRFGVHGPLFLRRKLAQETGQPWARSGFP